MANGNNLNGDPFVHQPNENVDQANRHLQPVNNAVRVPPFWRQNPELWFKQLEAQFSNSHIIQDLTKFNTIFGVIESDIISCVSDIVLNPSSENMYVSIRERLINRFADTEHKKLRSLLHDLSLGDSKPSDLLRKMRELSCGKVGDDLLKTLWLQRLPITIQTVLATSSDNIEQLSVMADTMFDITEGSTNVQANNSNNNKVYDDLVDVVDRLDGKIESLRRDFRESSKNNRQTF